MEWCKDVVQGQLIGHLLDELVWVLPDTAGQQDGLQQLVWGGQYAGDLVTVNKLADLRELGHAGDDHLYADLDMHAGRGELVADLGMHDQQLVWDQGAAAQWVVQRNVVTEHDDGLAAQWDQVAAVAALVDMEQKLRENVVA